MEGASLLDNNGHHNLHHKLHHRLHQQPHDGHSLPPQLLPHPALQHEPTDPRSQHHTNTENQKHNIPLHRKVVVRFVSPVSRSQAAQPASTFAAPRAKIFFCFVLFFGAGADPPLSRTSPGSDPPPPSPPCGQPSSQVPG